MPFASRIESESTRRWVIAGIMLALLAASTALAVALSGRRGLAPEGPGDGRGVSSKPSVELVDEPMGWLRIERPAGWSANRTPAVEDEVLQPLALFAEGGPGGRYLVVQEYTAPRPVTPRVALGVAQSFLPPTAGQALWGVRSEGMFGVIGQGMVHDGGEDYEQLVAVLTSDGRRYAVLNLTGLGRPSVRNLDLMRRIALSVTDRRYEPVGSRMGLGGGLVLDVPRGLTARRRADRSDGPVLMTPSEGGRFFLLSVDAGPLTDPTAARSRERMPPSLRAMLGSERDEGDLLPAMLVLRYWRATGEMPPRGSGTGFSLGDRSGYIVPLTMDAQSPTYRELWGVELDGQRALWIELIASPSAKENAQTAAKLLVQAMGEGGSGTEGSGIEGGGDRHAETAS